VLQAMISSSERPQPMQTLPSSRQQLRTQGDARGSVGGGGYMPPHHTNRRSAVRRGARHDCDRRHGERTGGPRPAIRPAGRYRRSLPNPQAPRAPSSVRRRDAPPPQVSARCSREGSRGASRLVGTKPRAVLQRCVAWCYMAPLPGDNVPAR
jgi:hypothetical protein